MHRLIFRSCCCCWTFLVATLLPAAAAPGFAAETPAPPQAPHLLLVGYFPQWGLYQEQPYTVKSLVRSGAAAKLDQLTYAQGSVSHSRCSVADPKADMEFSFTARTSVDGSADAPSSALRGNFHQLVELKRLYPQLKILISLEGGASDFAADAQPGARTAFVASCVDLFLKGDFGPQASAPGLFDGIDIDWEYPRGADSANYLPLLAEFRRQMDALRPGLRLTVALGADPVNYGDADLAGVGSVVDLAGLMTYDYDGPWSKTTGFIAPLSSASPGKGSVEASVSAWQQAGIPASKLLLGIPFYAYGWLNVSSGNHGLGQNGRPYQGDHPYWFIRTIIRSQSGRPAQSGGSAVPAQVAPTEASQPPPVTIYRDPVSKAPWLFDGYAFWTYEDSVSIRAKGNFAASQQLGGLMLWELSEDTASATLLNAADSALAQPDTSPAPVVRRRTHTKPSH